MQRLPGAPGGPHIPEPPIPIKHSFDAKLPKIDAPKKQLYQFRSPLG